MPIITHLTDQDLYKFSMQQVVFHQFPEQVAEYKFQDRGNVGLGFLAPVVREEINALADIKITKEEIDFLKTIKFLKSDYIDFLGDFNFLPEKEVVVREVNGSLEIRISGTWLHTILYEVMILSIVNECYFNDYVRMNTIDVETLHAEGEHRLLEKMDLIREANRKREWNWNYLSGHSPFIFSNFGTRRRFSKVWAERVDRILSKEMCDYGFMGTSNVYNAMRNGVKPIGTMAHEYLQAMQPLAKSLEESQDMAFERWVKEYRGDLGIALTDCLGLEFFLSRFDSYFSKLFDGLRHDSGDPEWWTDKVIDHYNKLRIDPRTKTAVYSDGLDVPKAIDLWMKYGDKIKTAFGIGTNLTCDVGPTPLKIVLKMVRLNGQPVAKISDSLGKEMCEDAEYIEKLRKVIGK